MVEITYNECMKKHRKTDEKDDSMIPNNNNGVTYLQNPTAAVPNLLDENKNDLLGKLFSGLLFEDRLLSFMNIRKGKVKVQRNHYFVLVKISMKVSHSFDDFSFLK